MPKLYASIKQDIEDAAKSLPKNQQADYIRTATATAKTNRNNCVPGS